MCASIERACSRGEFHIDTCRLQRVGLPFGKSLRVIIAKTLSPTYRIAQLEFIAAIMKNATSRSDLKGRRLADRLGQRISVQ